MTIAAVFGPAWVFGLSSLSSTSARPKTLPETILQRIARGESRAVQECIDRYGGLVWSLARKLNFVEADLEDSVQEIFLDVWKSSGRYDPSVASEATFIAMISRRRLIDRRRRLGRRTDTQELQDQEGPPQVQADELASISEEAATAARALEGLRPEQQRVLRLSIYQGLSHEKIAESTGLPLGTVKTHVRRGLIRLREVLERDRSGGRMAGAESVSQGGQS